jgi:hypothetical protein
MTGGAPSRLRGTRWIASRRSPRYDIWVSNTQVAAPHLYHPDCMALWDEALGRPMTEIHGHLAGEVRDDVATVASKLRARPDVPWSRDAARMLEFMDHLCAYPAWAVRVEMVTVTGYFELVAGVLADTITPDEAVRAARERGGTETDVRRELNGVKSAIDTQWEWAPQRRPQTACRCFPPSPPSLFSRAGTGTPRERTSEDQRSPPTPRHTTPVAFCSRLAFLGEAGKITARCAA